MAAARNRHVSQSLVYEVLMGVLGVNVDEDALNRLRLAAVAGCRIAVINMWMLLDVEFSIRDPSRAERRGCR